MIQAEVQRLLVEVDDFRQWASGVPRESRTGAWEVDYPRWPELTSAFVALLRALRPGEWSPDVTSALLFCVARDWDVGALANELKSFPEQLEALAQAALLQGEPDARWRLGDALAELDPPTALPLLEKLVLDSDEYVSRRALLQMGKLRAPSVESHAERAWASGHEYQRMAALQALHDAKSPRLEAFLALADEDGRQYLSLNARRIRSECRASGS